MDFVLFLWESLLLYLCLFHLSSLTAAIILGPHACLSRCDPNWWVCTYGHFSTTILRGLFSPFTRQEQYRRNRKLEETEMGEDMQQRSLACLMLLELELVFFFFYQFLLHWLWFGFLPHPPWAACQVSYSHTVVGSHVFGNLSRVHGQTDGERTQGLEVMREKQGRQQGRSEGRMTV